MRYSHAKIPRNRQPRALLFERIPESDNNSAISGIKSAVEGDSQV